MDLPTPLEVLQMREPARVQALIDALHADGIVFDESGLGLSSLMIERWSDGCEEFLRRVGYAGGPLSTGGKYFDGYAAIYMLYDTGALVHEAACKALDEFGAGQMRALEREG